MTVRRLLVFGRSGQLATALGRLADPAIWDIALVDRTMVDFSEPRQALSALRQQPDFDVAINAVACNDVDGAETDARDAQTVNCETPGLLAEHCAATGRPFLHVSTDFVFRGRPGGGYVETDTPHPLNAYGRSKLAGERRVLDAGTRHAVFRTAWVYSADRRNFVTAMLDLVGRQERVRVVADQIGNPTFADDLALALLKAAGVLDRSEAKGGLFHLAGTGQTSRSALAERVFELAAPLLGNGPAVEPITSDDWPTPAVRPTDASLRSDSFATTFSHQMPHWETSLPTAVHAWCRNALSARAKP
ncbi:dTDP-4-dehydrorhamnose reductase [Maricaulis maris]|uniref:dTDP-4-dehydrorhamnose reductase n=1 Tax=Maricaulis maris TaxID=74318 RepID=UPI002923B843|nr:NAD(P)-dependent oxidoreductase [Maricaulis maris]